MLGVTFNKTNELNGEEDQKDSYRLCTQVSEAELGKTRSLLQATRMLKPVEACKQTLPGNEYFSAREYDSLPVPPISSLPSSQLRFSKAASRASMSSSCAGPQYRPGTHQDHRPRPIHERGMKKVPDQGRTVMRSGA